MNHPPPASAGRAEQPAGPPPGYPREYQRRATLHDGRDVLIRPVLPSDGPGLAEAIKSADADTIHLRFLGGRPHVTPELIRYLTSVDYISRFALVAIDPVSQHGVAIARYERTGDDATAEVAIAVTPAWRQAGLATVLLRLLAQAAAERGIATLGGTYFADNRPVAALINDADGSAQRFTGHGIAEFTVALGFYPDASDHGNQP